MASPASVERAAPFAVNAEHRSVHRVEQKGEGNSIPDETANADSDGILIRNETANADSDGILIPNETTNADSNGSESDVVHDEVDDAVELPSTTDTENGIREHDGTGLTSVATVSAG